MSYSNMNTYTAIIVDDEQENLNILSIFLKKYCPEVSIIGETTNVEDAVDLINKTQPQILYLDIALEGKTSFEIIKSVKNLKSQIIFVTSFREYAIPAIQYGAVDYVLKPIDATNLKAATARAISKIKQIPKIPIKHLTISSVNKTDVINPNEIVYCRAEGRYTTFYMKNGFSILSSKNIGEYEKLLVNNFFFRIHQRYMVNVLMVASLTTEDSVLCHFKNSNLALPIAKRRLSDFIKYLKLT